MSSHREAPEISKDPVADSTDLYAFVSPDDPSTVTLIANYVPLQLPAGGPNFFQFGFSTVVEDPDTFLYNTGPITSLHDPTWNRRQRYSVTRIDHAGTHHL